MRVIVAGLLIKRTAIAEQFLVNGVGLLLALERCGHHKVIKLAAFRRRSKRERVPAPRGVVSAVRSQESGRVCCSCNGPELVMIVAEAECLEPGVPLAVGVANRRGPYPGDVGSEARFDGDRVSGIYLDVENGCLLVDRHEPGSASGEGVINVLYRRRLRTDSYSSGNGFARENDLTHAEAQLEIPK